MEDTACSTSSVSMKLMDEAGGSPASSTSWLKLAGGNWEDAMSNTWQETPNSAGGVKELCTIMLLMRLGDDGDDGGGDDSMMMMLLMRLGDDGDDGGDDDDDDVARRRGEEEED